MLWKALYDLFCFPFSLIFFYSPTCYLISISALSTCCSPNLPCLSQNSVLYAQNSSSCSYSSFSNQFKDPGPSLTPPPHHCCVTSDFYFQLPIKYSTWISQTSDSICLKLKICHLPQISSFSIVPTSVNGTTTYLLAKLEYQAPYWLILHNFYYVISC